MKAILDWRVLLAVLLLVSCGVPQVVDVPGGMQTTGGAVTVINDTDAGKVDVYPEAVDAVLRQFPNCPRTVHAVASDTATTSLTSDIFVIPSSSRYKDPFDLTADYLEACMRRGGFSEVPKSVTYAMAFTMVDVWLQDILGSKPATWEEMFGASSVSVYEAYVARCTSFGSFPLPLSEDDFGKIAITYQYLKDAQFPFWYYPPGSVSE